MTRRLKFGLVIGSHFVWDSVSHLKWMYALLTQKMFGLDFELGSRLNLESGLNFE